jgi:hypothetical protein
MTVPSERQRKTANIAYGILSPYDKSPALTFAHAERGSCSARWDLNDGMRSGSYARLK